MKDEGGYLFPHTGLQVADGLTRRDWLAGMVIQGLLANSVNGHTTFDDANVVRSYKLADQLIEESKK